VEASSRAGTGVIAQRAGTIVATLSGRRQIDRKDDEWCLGVEVVEVSCVPDSAGILAVYDVRLDDGRLGAHGGLNSFRQVRRDARGQVDCERRR
jgi:hypothetical protein